MFRIIVFDEEKTGQRGKGTSEIYFTGARLPNLGNKVVISGKKDRMIKCEWDCQSEKCGMRMFRTACRQGADTSLKA